MKYTTLYTLILGLFSIGWTDCPEDFMERMQRPGHSEIQLSKVMISGRVLDERGFRWPVPLFKRKKLPMVR